MCPQETYTTGTLLVMEHRAVWFGLAIVAIGVALGVRLMWQAPDAHELAHRKEAEAREAIERIKTLPPDEQKARLMPMLEPSQPPEVRVSALDALAELRPPDLITIQENALRDYHSAVRVRSAELAHHLPKEQALAFLINLTADHDRDVRQVAVQKLGELRDPRAVPALIRLLNDPSPEIVHSAMGALRGITGERYFARYTAPETERLRAIEQWRSWWQTAQKRYPDIFQPQPYEPERFEPAPNLTLQLLDGTQITLNRPERPILINFWGTWCAGCVAELPALIRLHEKYGERIQMVGIAYDEPEGAKGLMRFCEARGVRYPQMLANRAVEHAFHIHGVPQTILIDTQGRIRYWWAGTRDEETFARALKRVLE